MDNELFMKKYTSNQLTFEVAKQIYNYDIDFTVLLY